MNPPENCRPPFHTAITSTGEWISLQWVMTHVMRAPMTPAMTSRVAMR